MYEGAVQTLIDELGRLPGVGPKSAQRIAFHILNADAADMARLANAISTVKTSVSFCESAVTSPRRSYCTICRDERRDPSVLCGRGVEGTWWRLSQHRSLYRPLPCARRRH